MPRTVSYITIPPLSYEEEVKRLRIPKKRRKELEAMVQDTWAAYLRDKETGHSPNDLEASRKSAPAA
jgi:hypothetical protein